MKLAIILVITFISASAFGIKPVRQYAATPDQFGLSYRSERIITKDGATIQVWDIQPIKNGSTKKTSVIICGSDAGNMSYFLGPAIDLVKKGINVILFDYRGFGQSSDFEIDTTLIFHQEFFSDFNSVVSYTKQKHSKNKVGALGFSMGGYFPLLYHGKLDFIIADSPLLCPEKVIERLNKHTLRLLPGSLNVELDKVNSALIFLASNDKYLKFEDFTLESINNSLLQLVPYKGNHMQGFYKLGKRFTEQILGYMFSKR